MDRSVLEERSSFIILGLYFSSVLYWGSYIISIAKASFKKVRTLIHLLKFFSPEIALYLYAFTTRPSMEYCCDVCTGAPNCHLDMLGKLQQQMCGVVCPSLAISVESLAHL